MTRVDAAGSFGLEAVKGLLALTGALTLTRESLWVIHERALVAWSALASCGRPR